MKHKYSDIFIDLDNTLYDTCRLATEDAGSPDTDVCVAGAADMVDYLKHRGYRLHVCTNGSTAEQREKLELTGLSANFSTLITSEDVGVEKPDAHFFGEALRRTGASAATTLVIGDNFDTDMLGALRAGIDAMLFNRWQHDFVPPQPVAYIIVELTDVKKLL